MPHTLHGLVFAVSAAAMYSAVSRLFGSWTIRLQGGLFDPKVDYTAPGLFGPQTIRLQGGLFGPRWTIWPLDYSAPGLFGPWIIRPLDYYSAPEGIEWNKGMELPNKPCPIKVS